MGVKLISASAGSVEIVAPATASNYTATMPAGTGNVVVNGINSSIVSGTSQASTSGTSIDFTGIPSWVKRITVALNEVSLNATVTLIVQIGSTTFTTTGYKSGVGYTGTGTAAANPTAGYGVANSLGATNIFSGLVTLVLVGSNIWTASSAGGLSDSAFSFAGGGSLSLGATLDRVRITTIAGTATFDAGSINILYE